MPTTPIFKARTVRTAGRLIAAGLRALLIGPLLAGSLTVSAQVDEDRLGAWYMLFWSAPFEDSRWGLQGDIQHRNWDLGGDLEQLLLRGGVTYRPAFADVLLTLGYGNITSEAFGADDRETDEDRIYQEALWSQKFGARLFLRHRFRFEQRWVENQDFRTRFRYNLFVDVPLNRNDLAPGAVYASFYNELFINGQRDIGGGRRVDIFDRNRTYLALGYSAWPGLKLQFGYMLQMTDDVEKGQLQLSLHQSF
ncbi:MAG: DUF2490 domain-containing protein [Gammaproteobacteria bacterium]|nr:DUF2490 domain-containing protein [Gammaproteobacteria bacterium]